MKKGEIGLRGLVVSLTAAALAIILLLQGLYYLQIIRMNRENASAYAENAAAQAQGSLELTFSDMANVADNIGQSTLVQNLLTEKDPYEKYLLNNYVVNFLSTVKKTQARIENILLYDGQGELRYYYLTDHRGNRPTLNQLGLEDILSGQVEGQIPPARFLPVRDELGDRLACCLPFLGTTLGPNHGKLLGYIVLLLAPDTFQTLLWQREDEGVYLLDPERVPFSQEGARLSLPDGGPMLMTLEMPVGKTGWSVLFRADLKHTVKQYQFFQYTVLLVGVILMMLLVSWGLLIQFRVAKPVIRLKNELEHIDTAGLHAHISDVYRGEVGEIAGSVNRLLERLHELTRHIFQVQQEMYEAELHQKETVLYALQAQVNPHFLLNTLQCIAGIAASKNVPEIVSAALAMSGIFQYAIRDQYSPKGRGVTLRDELNVVREYLKIVEIRFMGQFQGCIEVDDSLLDCPCIKMMLQPLVENALCHGLENTYGKGTVQITGHRDGENICIKVEDSGAGMTPEELDRVRAILADGAQARTADIQKGKIGLNNIQRRLRMVYGKAYGLQILHSGPEGTAIQLTMPYSQREKIGE